MAYGSVGCVWTANGGGIQTKRWSCGCEEIIAPHFRIHASIYIEECIQSGDYDEAFDYIMTSLFFKNDKLKNEEYRDSLLHTFLPWLFD